MHLSTTVTTILLAIAGLNLFGWGFRRGRKSVLRELAEKSEKITKI